MPEPTHDRRSSDAALLILVQTVHDDVKSLDMRLAKHMTDETNELANALSKLMANAFPEGDPEGHKAHHEAVIKAAADRAKFWETMKVELSKYGLIGFIGWAIYALWGALLQGPHK